MGRPALVAFFTSLATTVAAFAALTIADRRGALDFLHGRRADVEVPSINGVSVEQARDLLRARDLLLTLQAERPDPTIPAGKIAGLIDRHAIDRRHLDVAAAAVKEVEQAATIGDREGRERRDGRGHGGEERNQRRAAHSRPLYI